MNRAIITLAAATLVAAAMSSSAQANCRGCGVGAGIAAGVIGGAIIGSAIANSQPRYYEEPAPVYAAPPPPAYAEEMDESDGPVCHSEKRQFWDGNANAYRTRRIQVCD